MIRFRVCLCVAGLWLAGGLTPAQGLVLEYKPEVGQTSTYKAMFAGRMQRAIEGDVPFATSKRYEVTATLTYTSEVLSQTADETTVELRMQQGQADVNAGDVAETVDLGALEAKVAVDRRRVATDPDMTVESELDEVHPDVIEALGTMELLGGQWLGLVDVLYLPEGEVEPGATWSHEPLLEEADLPFALKIDHRLVELTTRAGHKCAKIAVSWRAPFSDIPFPGGEEGAVGSASGAFSGEYLVYYDYENCLEVYVDGAVGASVTATVSEPSITLTQNHQLNVKASLVE
jgi:hypothetical protein